MIEKVDMMIEMRIQWYEGGYDDRNVGTMIENVIMMIEMCVQW